MPDTITPEFLRFERRLAAPLHTVWRHLVDPELRARWFMGGGVAGEVTFALQGEGAQTRLELTHTGLRGRDDAVNFGAGWHAHLAVLERRIKAEAVLDFWALHSEAEQMAESALRQASI